MARKKSAPNEGGYKVETWPLEKILPYPGNPRTITDKAVEKVAKSLKTYGWRQPIVVDEGGVIVVGHTRRLAAKALGLTEAPVHVARGLTASQIRAYRIADNRVADETEWDRDKLILELGNLSDLDVNLEDLGFDEVDLGKLLGEAFAPTLAPEADHGKVTGEDVEKADGRLKGTVKDGAKQDIVDVICPHCAKEFGIARSHLV